MDLDKLDQRLCDVRELILSIFEEDAIRTNWGEKPMYLTDNQIEYLNQIEDICGEIIFKIRTKED